MLSQCKNPSLMPNRVLLLGGTGEASAIAARLAMRKDLVLISSLAGRVHQPRLPEGRLRVGGFGGLGGLCAYLRHEAISIVIDATHPFATRIGAHAQAACRELGLPLIALARLQWEASKGDCWHPVPDMESAAVYVARQGGRVFLTVGRQQTGAFTLCRKAWFLARCIDPPEDPLPPNVELLLERGPFTLEHELHLLRTHAIDCIVSKNSGGAATYSKIEAARILGIPVVMVDRPRKHTAHTVETVDGVLAALSRLQPEEGLGSR